MPFTPGSPTAYIVSGVWSEHPPLPPLFLQINVSCLTCKRPLVSGPFIFSLDSGNFM